MNNDKALSHSKLFRAHVSAQAVAQPPYHYKSIPMKKEMVAKNTEQRRVTVVADNERGEFLVADATRESAVEVALAREMANLGGFERRRPTYSVAQKLLQAATIKYEETDLPLVLRAHQYLELGANIRKMKEVYSKEDIAEAFGYRLGDDGEPMWDVAGVGFSDAWLGALVWGDKGAAMHLASVMSNIDKETTEKLAEAFERYSDLRNSGQWRKAAQEALRAVELFPPPPEDDPDAGGSTTSTGHYIPPESETYTPNVESEAKAQQEEPKEAEDGPGKGGVNPSSASGEEPHRPGASPKLWKPQEIDEYERVLRRFAPPTAPDIPTDHVVGSKLSRRAVEAGGDITLVQRPFRTWQKPGEQHHDPRRILILIDESGSMSGTPERTLLPLAAAISRVWNTVTVYHNTRFAVEPFEGELDRDRVTAYYSSGGEGPVDFITDVRRFDAIVAFSDLHVDAVSARNIRAIMQEAERNGVPTTILYAGQYTADPENLVSSFKYSLRVNDPGEFKQKSISVLQRMLGGIR